MQKTIIWFVLAAISYSCGFESDMESLSIGDDFVSSRSTLSVVDSFSVDMSTVLIDSIITAGKSGIWAGKYTDRELGKVVASGYFELGIPEAVNVGENDIFDSLLLVMNYNKKYFGDTTVTHKIGIHRLTEEMEGDNDGNFWNRSSVSYDPVPLGTISFKPRPSLNNSLKIRLPDVLGQEWLTMLKKKDETISSFEKFREYFNGLIITPGEQSSVILSFPCDSSMKVILHTHRKGLETENYKLTFPVGSTKTCFTGYTADRSGTPIAAISRQVVDIPSSRSDQKTYVQSGTGLLTRIDFPTMQQLMEMDRKYILLKAELILVPEPGTYRQVPLPSQLVLFHTDKSNRMVSEIVGDQNATLAADLSVDDMFNETTRYIFDITDFITTEISDSYFDTTHGLLIGEPGSSIGASLNRVVFCDRKNSAYRPQVRLYFMHYNL